jgi:hypothetical protein
MKSQPHTSRIILAAESRVGRAPVKRDGKRATAAISAPSCSLHGLTTTLDEIAASLERGSPRMGLGVTFAMALISCADCGFVARERETSCPECGAALRRADGSLPKTAAAVLLGLAVGAGACTSSAPEYGVPGTGGNIDPGSGGFGAGEQGGGGEAAGAGGAGGGDAPLYGIPGTGGAGGGG